MNADAWATQKIRYVSIIAYDKVEASNKLYPAETQFGRHLKVPLVYSIRDVKSRINERNVRRDVREEGGGKGVRSEVSGWSGTGLAYSDEPFEQFN